MKPFRHLFFLLLLAVAYAACKSDTDIIPQTHGNVMVLNSVPAGLGFNPLSVMVDTTMIANQLNTGDTSGFSTFRSQLYPVYFLRGTGNVPYVQTEVTIRNNHNFSFFLVYDTLPQVGQPNVTGLITDDTLRKPASQTVNLRVVDLSRSFLGSGDTATTQYMTVAMDYDTLLLYNGMTFRQVGVFRTIAPGPHKLYFRTVNDSVWIRRYTMDLNLAADYNYTVYTSGSLMRTDQFKAFLYKHWK